MPAVTADTLTLPRLAAPAATARELSLIHI